MNVNICFEFFNLTDKEKELLFGSVSPYPGHDSTTLYISDFNVLYDNQVLPYKIQRAGMNEHSYKTIVYTF